MKRFWILLLVLLLLTGCGTDDPIPTEPPAPTEPWIDTVGMEWDADGVLREIPLTIPDGLHFSSVLAFDGDLLLWSMDLHRSDAVQLELCLVDLDTGTVAAARDVNVNEYVVPQVMGGYLYLCDAAAGQVLQLDKALADVKAWTVEPNEGSWYMGQGEQLYMMDMNSGFDVCDLNTGAVRPVLEGDPEVSWVNVTGTCCSIEYYRADTGAADKAVLDLTTGTIHEPPVDEDYDSVSYVGGTWLCGTYREGYSYHLTASGAETMYIPTREGYLTLLPEGDLLDAGGDQAALALYEPDGSLISACRVLDNDSGYAGNVFIWNENLGGYFFPVHGFDESMRLLFWDIGKSAGGEDLAVSPLPEPDEAQLKLQQRAKAIGDAYGLTVLVGTDCETQFEEFSATQATDWDAVSRALDILENALDDYPEGFLRQLRFGEIRGIQIQLVCDLLADGSGRYGDGYLAFAQPRWDHYVMVMDIDVSNETTYYHEFSHVIDSYLAWDAEQRPEALFSEEGWAQWNPGWFDGYSYDYSQQHDLKDLDHFVDSYSTIKPTEDRARVLEYAMAEYGHWTFENAAPLKNKLDYYCRCIRDAFDTTGWPETVLWEQYLN